MKTTRNPVAGLFLRESSHTFDQYLPRIVKCLQQLSDEDIWWRPNAASNSVGNLVLHLCGNVRQWIISGLGEKPDVRIRDKEFAEKGPLPRSELIAKLRGTVREAKAVLQSLPPESLSRAYTIQGFKVTGLVAIAHVYEHFSYHAGQIIYVTKMKSAKDQRFTKLPKLKFPGTARKHP